MYVFGHDNVACNHELIFTPGSSAAPATSNCHTIPLVPKLTFVVGKGGVGKTTVSCALALHLAAKKPREQVLLLSTDPAHSLADMLQTRLGATPKKLGGAKGPKGNGVKGQLSAWQIDSDREFKKFLSGNRDAILNIIENGTFFNREEIAPLLDTTLPGMAEVAGLLAIQRLLEGDKYTHIVVDTAPFGHTLRLFELPAHFQRFLHFLDVASSRDALLAQRFGGRVLRPAAAFLERWQAMVDQLAGAFTAQNAEILLVTSPETFSLNEARRSMAALEKSVPAMTSISVVLNRAVVKNDGCHRCRRRASMTTKAMLWLKRNFPRRVVLHGPDPGNPVLGVGLLKNFGDVVFGGESRKLEQRPPTARAKLKFRKLPWPAADVPLSFTVGKGGVGKTTTTAALAFRTRAVSPGQRVTVCSTDPAPSLDDVFQQEIGDDEQSVLGDSRFGAMELDAAAEFRAWAERMQGKLNSELSMQSGGLHVDLTFEKEVFSALMDVVPPGVDEVFAIFRIMDLLERGDVPEGRDALTKGKRREIGERRVMIDMAPTGHALELLRMPERILAWSRLLLKSLSAHRTLSFAQDVAVELATLGQRVRKLLEMMKDARRSRVYAVMLAEPVPDQQTRRLLRAIAEIGVSTDALFVNRTQIEEPGRCKRCMRSRDWQLVTLKDLKRKYSAYRIYLLPEFAGEIAGAAALKKFTTNVWQIATQP
jgi:arsenite/tail-anchored protein-transporting ATPase